MNRRLAVLEPDELQTLIIASARETAKLIGGCDMKRAREFVDDHEVVFGAWKDRTAPGGHRSITIKGQALLDRLAVMPGPKVYFDGAALPCRSYAEARYYQRTFGEYLRVVK